MLSSASMRADEPGRKATCCLSCGDKKDSKDREMVREEHGTERKHQAKWHSAKWACTVSGSSKPQNGTMTAWDTDNLSYSQIFRIFKLCKLGKSADCRSVTFPVWHRSPAVTCEGRATAVNDDCIPCFKPPTPWHPGMTRRQWQMHTHTHTLYPPSGQTTSQTAAHQTLCHIENIINHKLAVCECMHLEGGGRSRKHWSSA